MEIYQIDIERHDTRMSELDILRAQVAQLEKVVASLLKRIEKLEDRSETEG